MYRYLYVNIYIYTCIWYIYSMQLSRSLLVDYNLLQLSIRIKYHIQYIGIYVYMYDIYIYIYPNHSKSLLVINYKNHSCSAMFHDITRSVTMLRFQTPGGRGILQRGPSFGPGHLWKVYPLVIKHGNGICICIYTYIHIYIYM